MKIYKVADYQRSGTTYPPDHSNMLQSPDHQVWYSHVKEDPTQTAFRYKSLHLPTGEESEREVWCYNQNDFNHLLRMWNSIGKNFKYTVI